MSDEDLNRTRDDWVSENLRMMLPSFFTKETGLFLDHLRMMLPSFFTKETGGYFIVLGFHYTEYWQAYEPYKAMATCKSAVPITTLVIGHNDLSTGGMPRHDPD